MKKSAKPAAVLREMALNDIRRHEGCESVGSISVRLIKDDRAECNWSIAVSDLGSADGYLARRTALIVHERLCRQFDLIDDVQDGVMSDESKHARDTTNDVG